MVNSLINDCSWIDLVSRIRLTGSVVSPRNMPIRELFCCQTIWDMRYPILRVNGRDLNYPFMFDEARHILTGDSRVSTVTAHCKKIANYSDDGIRFSGAYGPMILEQVRYVTDTLRLDPDSRQATLTIWRPNPRPSKDIPCTIAMSFYLRNYRLNTVVFMRSSDAWLGLPYDIFNFTMITHLVRVLLRVEIVMGLLYITAGSQHLYEHDLDKTWDLSPQDPTVSRDIPNTLDTYEDLLAFLT